MKTRKAYQEMLEDQLKELDAKVEMLKAKADKAKIEIKIKYYEQIQELKSKQQLARKKFNDLRETGDEAWEEVKTGVDKALRDLKKAINRAISKFKRNK